MKNIIILLIGSIFTIYCNRKPKGFIMTITGEVQSDKLGRSLIHEHITTDFIGAEKINQPQYNIDSAYNTILPFLIKLKEQGVNSFFECTPNYIGRDVNLLKRLSGASGINIITNTGYYAAMDKKYLPKHVYEESTEQLAQRWLSEWRNGIGGTEIRPGFIKLGVGEGAVDSIETKLILAAIKVHKESGLTIAIHTGNGDAALSEYELF